MSIILPGKNIIDPRSLNPTWWIDPSDITTLFKNTDLTNQVTADGDVIKSIKDRSNNNYRLKSISTSGPTYKTAYGRSWFHFDGTGATVLEGNAQPVSDLITAGTFDLLIACNVTSATDSATPYANSGIWADGGYNVLNFRTSGIAVGYIYDGVISAVQNITFVNKADMIVHYRHAYGNAYITINNGPTFVIAKGNATLINTAYYLGSSYAANNPTVCDIYGILEKKTLFTPSELILAKAWLASKIGLQLDTFADEMMPLPGPSFIPAWATQSNLPVIGAGTL